MYARLDLPHSGSVQNSLVALSNEITAAVDAAGPYVVSIQGRQRRASAGVHWQPGIVVTASHALENEEDIPVVLPDGSRTKATFAGRDASVDVAVLRVDSQSLNVPSVAAGPFRTGEIALAVGRTIEGSTTAQLGVLSVLPGPWRTWRGGELDTRLRLDFALSPSGSGSVAINAAGEVLGMATNGLSRFAALVIPAVTINRALPYLLDKGFVPRGYLGVALQPVALREHPSKQRTGLILLNVEPDGPAAKAGMHVGDILISFAGHELSDPADLQAQLSPDRAGATVTLGYIRGGITQQTEITPGERP